MPDRLNRFAQFILGPSAKADDDDFEPEAGADEAEEPTDIVEMEVARPAVRDRPRPVRAAAPAAPTTPLEQRRRPLGARPLTLSEIVHVRPRSFSEAAGIGESFKEGLPVILNFTATDEKQAQKLIDFAAGMAYVTDGKLEKITARVFILIPAAMRLTETERTQLTETQFTKD